MRGARNLQQLCMVQVAYNSFVSCRYLTTVMYDAGTLQLCMIQVTYNSYYDAGSLQQLRMVQVNYNSYAWCT